MLVGLRRKFRSFVFTLMSHSLFPCTIFLICTGLEIGVMVAQSLQVVPVMVSVPRERAYKHFRCKYICEVYKIPSTSHVTITSQNQASQEDTSRMEAKRTSRKQRLYLFTWKHTSLIATHCNLPEDLTAKRIDSDVLFLHVRFTGLASGHIEAPIGFEIF